MPVVIIQGRPSSPLVVTLTNFFRPQKEVRIKTFQGWRGGLEDAVKMLDPKDVALIVSEVQDGGHAPQNRILSIRSHNRTSPVLLIIPRGWEELSAPRGARVGLIEKPLTSEHDELTDLVEELLEPNR